MKRLLGIFLTVATLALWPVAALAVEQASGALEQEAAQIETLLRCPVCTGQTLAESHVEKAQELKREIRRMLAQGKTRQEILDYYASRYGEWILTQPRSPVVWAIPVVVLAVGAVVLVAFLRRSGRSAPAAAAGAAAVGAPAGGGVDPAMQDEINRQLQNYL